MKRNFAEWLLTFTDSIANYRYYIDFETIYKNAEIYKIDILTERAMPKLTSKILREEKIDKAQFYKDGFIALTGKGRIYFDGRSAFHRCRL